MKLILDMDSIIVDLMTPWLKVYNALHDDNATMDTFKTWDMHEHVKGGKAIYGIINQPGFFRHLPFLDGAEDGVKELVRRGHDIWVVSSAVFPCNYTDKMEWMAQYLPMIPKKRIVLMDAKHEIAADALVDDGPHNAKAYREAHPMAKILTIGYPYNKSCPYFDVIAGDHNDTRAAWARILQELP